MSSANDTRSTDAWRRGLHAARARYRLEARVMLDGAALAAADALDASDGYAANDATHADAARSDAAAEARENAALVAALSQPRDADRQVDLTAERNGDRQDDLADETVSSNETRRDVVVVDTSIADWRDLLADIDGTDDPARWTTDPDTGIARFDADSAAGSVTVYAIDGDVLGLDGIALALDGETGIDALHVLSHGEEAAIRFGGELIDTASFDARASTLDAWGDSLAADGDLLLYGCEIGDDTAGRAFVDAIAMRTGADVAASDDPTGSTRAGGDFELEVHVGTVATDEITGAAAEASFDGLLAATPSATLALPAEAFINEGFTFDITLDNAGSDPGYVPYLDVLTEPGVSIDGANFLGAPVTLGDSLTWNATDGEWQDAGGTAVTEHPLSAAVVLPGDPGIDGMRWIVVEFPFGSFVPSQPAATMTFAATLDAGDGAVVGAPLAIRAQPGFAYGEDAFDNAGPPDNDPPIVGTLASASITPSVLEIDKDARSGGPDAVGAEDEHATGPNNPITWEITVDIADGETVDNVVIADTIGTDVHYLDNLVVTGSGVQTGQSIANATVGVSAANELVVSFASVTGTAAADDIVIRYDGYIPELDADGTPVLDPTTGQADALITNRVEIDAEYAANPLTDAAEHDIRAEAIATQKSVTVLGSDGTPAGRSTTVPGDLLEWTLAVQISDHVSLDDIVLADDFGDGHVYVAGSARLSAFENGASSVDAPMASANVQLGAIDSATGLTRIDFQVSDELIARGVDATGQLDGDLATDGSISGKTVFTVTFRTEVQEDFQFPTNFGGDSSVDIGDRLTNVETVNAALVASGAPLSEGSAASVLVTTPETSKTIYAIAGDTDGFDAGDPELAPGQTVTYRITIELPTNDVEGLVVTDYLPLPVFDVPAGYGYAGQFSGADSVPPAGSWGFGPETNAADFPAGFFDTDAGGEPLIVDVTTDDAANSLTWTFQSFNEAASSGGTIDLLFTTVTEDVAFDDGVRLTNQAQIAYDNTNNPQTPSTSIVQIETLAPDLAIAKGAVALDADSNGSLTETALPASFAAPGTSGAPFAGTISSSALETTPIDADIIDVDADDTVRFALVVENTGGFSATDIRINDDRPAGFDVPAGGLNLTATLGDGTALGVTGQLFDASGTADPAGLGFTDGGSELTLARGHVDDAATPDGSNVIIITYDLVVATTAVADSALENTANLLAFAAFDAGTDYTENASDPDWQDTATATLVTAGVTKTLVNTSIDAPDNERREAVAGERVAYQVVIEVPEGSLDNARIVDRLDPGLAFDSLTAVTVSSNDVTSSIGNLTTDVVASVSGQQVTFDLGDIVNTNTADGTPETITLTYEAYVLATAATGGNLNNRADLRWSRLDGTTAQERNSAETVRVIAPELDVDKTIVGAPPGSAGDSVTYEIRIAHTAGSEATAFDASLSDILPSELTGVQIDSITGPATATAGFTLSGNTLSNPDFDLAEGESIVIRVSGTLDNATVGAPIANTADLAWTSLDADAPTDGRDADEASFTDTSTATFTVNPPTIDKTVAATGIDSPSNGATTTVVDGEWIDYRVVITVPQGEVPAARLVDTLPAGVVFDASTPVTVTPSSTDVTFTGTPTAPTVSGQDLIFDLGQLVNADRDDATTETLTIVYRAHATSGSAGSDLINTATLAWDLTGDGDADDATDGRASDTASVRFEAPVLTVDQTVLVTPGDANDTVRYRLTIEHAGTSSADAYDVSLTDLLPDSLENVTLLSAVDTGGADRSGDVSVIGNAVSAGDLDIALGDRLVLEVTATVVADAAATSTIVNTVDIAWSSLDDGAGQGDENTETDGTASAERQVTLASPTFVRDIVSTGIDTAANDDGELVAGEYVTVSLTVTVPEGETRIATVVDTLSTGLVFDPAYPITVTPSAGVTLGNGAAATPTVTATGGGQEVAFDLGTVTNANTGDSGTDTVTITYRAQAANTVADGDPLDASAVFAWDTTGNASNADTDDGRLVQGESLAVVHPLLTLAQSVATTPAEPVDGGDTLTYTYTISHAPGSTADARDAAFRDELPSELDNVTLVSATHSADGDVSPDFTVTGNEVENDDFTLALGDTITVVVSGTLNDSIVADSTLANTADLDWDTLDDDDADDGVEAAERTGATDATTTVAIDAPTFDKVIVATGIDTASNDDGQVVAGEYIEYELRITVPEGTTRDAVIVDALDANAIYDTGFAPIVTLPSGVTATVVPTHDAGSNTLTVALGDIVNAETDDGDAETITIRYRVYADTDVNAGDTLIDNATLRWDVDGDGSTVGSDNGQVSAGTSVTVVAPELIVENTLTRVPAQTGDAVEYTVTIRHTDSDAGRDDSSTTAYDVDFTDTVPASVASLAIAAIVDENGDAVDVASSGFTVDTVTNTVSHAGGFDLALGASFTLTLTGTADATTVEGDAQRSNAAIGWTTLDADDAADGRDAAEATGADADEAVFSLADITRTITATGIADPNDPDDLVVAGEWVDIRMTVVVPQGAVDLAAVIDTLDAGLVFDPTTPVTVTASGPNLSTDLAGGFAGATSAWDAGNGRLTVELGNVDNTAPDGTFETLTIDYRAFVADDATTAISAVPGTSLDGTAAFLWDIDRSGSRTDALDGATTDAGPAVTVREAELAVESTLVTPVDPAVPVDAGDVLRFEVVIDHTAASTADAFDATFDNALPPELANAVIVSAIDAGGAPVGGFTVSPDGRTVSHADVDLALGDSITLVYEATVTTTASASTLVTDDVAIDWDSLGDDAQGNQAVEATGSATDTATFTVDGPAFARSVTATGIDGTDGELAPGEFVEVTLVVTVPEGTTPLAAITETLDPGLVFDPDHPVTVTGSAGVTVSNASATTPSVAGDTVRFELGTVINANAENGTDGTPDSVDDTVTVVYRAILDPNDAPAGTIVDGATVGSDSTFVWDDDADGDNTDTVALTGSDTLTVVEPDLSVTHTVTQIPSDTGDPIRYEIVIAHTAASTADAYDVTLSDVLPLGVENVTVLSALDGGGAPVAGFVATGDDATGWTVSHAGVDLAEGDTITLVIEGTLGEAITEGTTVAHDVNVGFSSLDAESAPEDGAADGLDAAERDYATADTASFSIGDITKTVVATGIDDGAVGGSDDREAVSGEWIDYRIVVEIPQGTTALAEIVDRLDPGVTLDPGTPVTVTPSSANLSTTAGSGDFSDITALADSDNVLTLVLGDVFNAAPTSAVETLTVDYRVFVSNDDIDAAPGTALDATPVNVRWDIDGDGSNTGPDDGSSDASAPVVIVTAPVLEVDGEVTRVPSDHGDRIEQTFTIAHAATSTADAFDATFSTVLPAGLGGTTIVSAVDATGQPIDGFVVLGNTVSHPSLDLARGDTVTLIVAATVTDGTPVGDTLAIPAAITWTSLDAENAADGADALDAAHERIATDDATTDFSIADVSKRLVTTGIDTPANGASDVVPGEYVVYELTATLPEGELPRLALIDDLPPGLIFDSVLTLSTSSGNVVTSAGAGDLSSSTLPAAGATGTLTFDLGDVLNSDATDGTAETVTIAYRAIVADSAAIATGGALSGPVDLVYDIDGDGDNRGPLDGTTEASPEPLRVREPALAIDKTVDDADPHLGQRVTFTVVVDNADDGSMGGSDAFDVTLSDRLPPELTLDPTSVRIDGVAAADDPNVTDTAEANALGLVFDRIALGATHVITFDAIVTTDPTLANLGVDTAARVDWSSLSSLDPDDGRDATERDGATGYTATAPVALVPVVPDYAVAISSDATGPLSIGDPVGYTIDVQNVGTHLGTGVTIDLPWPVAALGEPASISDGGRYDAVTGTVIWTLDGLDVGERHTFLVQGRVLDPQIADADADPSTTDDRLALTASVTDDSRHGMDPVAANDSASVEDTIAAAPDYIATIESSVLRAAATSEVPYVLTVSNDGTQGGTGVVVVHRFDPAIVRIVEPDGGVVDAAAGTVTWTLDGLAAGETRTFEITAEVLPDAFLTTPEQLFSGTVAVQDDNRNGADPTPGNNGDATDVMLIGSPGELGAALPPPAATASFSDSAPPVTPTRLLTAQTLRDDPIGTDRFLTPERLRGDETGLAFDGGPRLHDLEDDPVNGGDLLDVFRSDVVTCEVIGIDWDRYEPTEQDLGLPPESSATLEFEQRLLREYRVLHGEAATELVEAMRALESERERDAG